MADVAADLKTWSATASSNSPAGTTGVGTGLAPNLREIQKVVRQDLATKGADIASATTTDLGAVAGVMHDITGTTTITSFGTVSAGIWKYIKFEGALTLTHNATSLILPGAANITTADGDTAIVISEGSGNWRCITYVKAANAPSVGKLPSQQKFTSGSGTYTTPAGCTYIKVRMVGGGGGGGGANTPSGGSAGGDTTFGTAALVAAGGGLASAGAGGTGGSASGTITNGTIASWSGGDGQGGGAANSTGNVNGGGQGGASPFGGAGSGSLTGGQVSGGAAKANTGSGGGGGAGASSVNAAGGGGAGAYIEALISTPAATYAYAVGAAGSAQTGLSTSGGAGAAGIIIVDEFYV